jgi:hypothetical protein
MKIAFVLLKNSEAYFEFFTVNFIFSNFGVFKNNSFEDGKALFYTGFFF